MDEMRSEKLPGWLMGFFLREFVGSGQGLGEGGGANFDAVRPRMRQSVAAYLFPRSNQPSSNQEPVKIIMII